MRLTETQIKNAKPQEKTYTLSDGGGLYLLINPNGGKWWRLKFYYQKKERLISFGVYPTVSLKEARKRQAEAKELLVKGVDPGEHKKAVKQAIRSESQNSYEIIAREWLNKYAPSWSETNRLKVTGRQEKDIFPLLGSRPISSITPPELLAALRVIENRGAIDTAHRVLQDCGRIFRYAIATGRAERDPAADLRGALPPAKSNTFVTITDPKEVGGLLRALDAYTGYVVVSHALRLAPLVFVRPGELRQAEWAEFNFEANEWRIPAAKMKMKQVHIVPLARQALAIIDSLQPYTGHGKYLFPSPRANDRPISDVALLAALRRMGFTKNEMVVHGFRSMASTLLNELGYNRDWIERQLAHGERNSIRAAYNYAEYLPERRRMMQEWADYLDSLRAEK